MRLGVWAGSASLLVLACSGSVERIEPSSVAAAGQGAGGQGGTAGAAGAPIVASTGGSVFNAGAATGGVAAGGQPGTAGAAGAPIGGCTFQTKGGACTVAGDRCVKVCGPQSVGQKMETCEAGVYVEGVCTFDCANSNINWACYAGLAQGPECPSGTQSAMPCTMAPCAPCQGVYLDAAGTMRTGGCVCAGAPGSEKWSCATSTAWPQCQ